MKLERSRSHESPESLIDEAGRIAVDVNYESYSSKFDEIIRAELCDSEEMIRLRQLLISNSTSSRNLKTC